MSDREPRAVSTSRVAPTDAASGRLCLLVIGGDDQVATHVLPDSGEVTIGRSDRCYVMIDDPSISRRHAILFVGTPIRIEDLGGVNGTTVRDRRLGPAQAVEIAVGESIQLGSVMVMVQQRTSSLRPRRLWTHGYFEGRIEEECARAERARSSFAVLFVHTHRGVSPSIVQETFAAVLRTIDVAGSYGSGEYEVFLPDATAADAEQVAKRISSQLAERGAQAQVGAAMYPADGRNPDSLVSKAASIARGEKRIETTGLHVVAKHGAMEHIYRLAERIAASNISVLIMGETGVGKEVLAETVHRHSHRADKPFLRLNCSALSETLLESELFGHERGAFTGATQAKPGLLGTANGGTVFIDEIGELPLSTQVKLLRVIEERQVLPVGSVKSRHIDVRFVAATNRDLEVEIGRGTFRQDLYFRLNGITLMIPPLRERVEEIEGLAEAFLDRACKQSGRRRCELSPAALALLHEYSWPGNIRELRNVIERAVLLSGDGLITPEHLPVDKMTSTFATRSAATATLPASEAASEPIADPLARARLITPPIDAVVWSAGDDATLPGARVTQPMPAAAAPYDPTGYDPQRMRRELEDAERQHILHVLTQCAGNQTLASRRLGISRRTLLNKLDSYGVPRPRKGRTSDEE